MAEPPYPFLSEEWIEAGRLIREEHAGGGIPVPSVVRMNQNIPEVPFGDGTVAACAFAAVLYRVVTGNRHSHRHA